MSNSTGNEPEKISSDAVISRGEVSDSDEMKVKWALFLSGAAVVIGVAFLITGLVLKDAELRTWATGLISLVVGAALGFAFSGSSRD